MMICGRGEQGGMTIHNTCIFLLVVHHHSVSEAARNLDLARPSFSVAIQEIEREYQVQLGYAEGLQMPRKQLFQENFLLWEKGSGTQDVVVRGDGTPLEPLWEATSTTALLHAVESRLCVTVLLRLAADYAAKQGRFFGEAFRGSRCSRPFSSSAAGIRCRRR